MNTGVDFEIREVSPSEPKLFAEWLATMRSAYSHGRSGVWWSSPEATIASFEDPSPFTRRIAAVALMNDEVVGGAELDLPLKENTNSISVELGVLPQHRRRGAGWALAHWARSIAAAHDRTVVEAEVYVPPDQSFVQSAGGAFATAQGLEPQNVEDRFLLRLPYPEDELKRHEAGLPTTGDRIVSWCGAAPQEYVAALALLQTQMNNDVPTGGLSRAAVEMDVARIRLEEKRMAAGGWVSVLSLALDSAGDPVGYTELLVSRNESEFVLQEDTLVLPEHRGRRLGLRLKCANLRVAQGLGADLMGKRIWLQTYTAQTNAPMQRTNAQFGFAKADELYECEGRL